jgi:flagellar basal-body rod protein FlgB
VLDDVATVTLQAALGGLAMRQQVTANNIANLQTPGFVASDVSFEASLADAVGAGDPAQALVNITADDNPAGLNGNNVSLADQMVTATKTGLDEQLLTRALTSKFGLISTVLKG